MVQVCQAVFSSIGQTGLTSSNKSYFWGLVCTAADARIHDARPKLVFSMLAFVERA